ncbi:SDR family oxidoreductase [Bacillus spongiae]|uniref:SDR family oxidoreductase n=1 Tax=Bacillus spongiae TaxID=2683610 RepID=A0ABU8HHU2_9BACI
MNLFLTGSTGFLGGKLIKNLLQNKIDQVFILVRNREKAEKLRASFEHELQSKIHILKGDVTLPNAGLSHEEIESLTGKIDGIYHLAALVKFDLDLREELFTINYDGTKNILELAERLKVRKFYYVSTAYTVGKSSMGVEKLYQMDNEFNNPYEESKAKAEHLVFSYQEKMDVSIFRPAIIVGDSKNGEADSQFTLYGFMRALDVFKRKVARRQREARTYRLIAEQNGTSNLVPVDYVADILSLAPEKARKNQIYHITNPNPPLNSRLLDMLKTTLQFSNLDVVEDSQLVELDAEEVKLNGLIEVFKTYLSRDITFEDRNTQELIKDTKVVHLELTDKTIDMIIKAARLQKV